MKRSCSYLVMLFFAVHFSLVDISELCVKESSKEEEEKGTACGVFFMALQVFKENYVF